MNCSTCRVNKISPEINPFGGYFCSNEHLQCSECNDLKKGQCGICDASTKFIQMNFNSPRALPEQILPSTAQFGVSSVVHTQMLEEIETQSRLSMEHLSMKDSRESIIQNKKEAYNSNSVNEAVSAKEHCNKNKNFMETMFVGTTPVENSVSSIDNSIHQDLGEGLNVGKVLKVENKKSFKHSSTKYENGKTENIFLFKEDPNDSNQIQKFDICFINSTESFHNFNTATKPNVLATTFSNNNKQLSSLSVKVLHDFETQNSANSGEVVKNYLETYSPTTFQQSPSYNCQYSYCDFSQQPRKQKIEMTMKTVNVSTESDPSLESTCLGAAEENLATKFKPHDYLIMQAVQVPHSIKKTLLDKTDKPSMDMRMQKILETLKEDSKITKLVEKSNLIKLPTQVAVKPHLEKEHIEKQNLKMEDSKSDLITRLLNTHRAVYNPPNPLLAPVNILHLLPQPQPVQQEPPLPQFQRVPCSSVMDQQLLLNQSKFFSFKPVPAFMLNIPRSPIQCPESTCQRMIFVSDFNKHLVVDHSHLPMERVSPFQCKNFFLDARLAHCGTSKCNLLYLMRDKIADLGSSEYKDLLPILVMTTRISLNEMCGLRNQTSALEFFLIWVTGIAPEEFPISVSLTVWSRSGSVPSCHVVYSGQMYSIRKSQRAVDVWRSGRMLLLSVQEIDALTSNGKEMLNLQLSVH